MLVSKDNFVSVYVLTGKLHHSSCYCIAAKVGLVDDEVCLVRHILHLYPVLAEGRSDYYIIEIFCLFSERDISYGFVVNYKVYALCTLVSKRSCILCKLIYAVFC